MLKQISTTILIGYRISIHDLKQPKENEVLINLQYKRTYPVKDYP